MSTYTYFDPYEKQRKRERLIRDFIKKYSLETVNNMPELKSISRNNLNVYRLSNEYMDLYKYTSRLLAIIVNYLREYIDSTDLDKKMKNLFNVNFMRLSRIAHSIKEQNRIHRIIRNTIKKVNYNSEMAEAFESSTQQMMDRLHRFEVQVFPMYINIIPLYDYIEILNKKGITFNDDLNEHVKYDGSSIEEIERDMKEYTEFINETINNHTKRLKYKKNLKEYQKTFKHQEAIKEAEKAEKSKEERKAKIDRAQEMLYEKVKILRNNYDNCFESPEHLKTGTCGNSIHTGISIIKSRAIEFKQQHKCDEAKIFIYMSVNARSFTTNLYFPCDSMPNQCIGISKANIYRMKAKLPKDLKKRVDNGEIVYTEFII